MKSHARVTHDFYETNARLTHELLKNIDTEPRQVILEPFAGNGAIARELKEHTVVTNDIKHYGYPLDYQMNALSRPFWDLVKRQKGIDWVISNPPYTDAATAVSYALEYAAVGVAMLLRLSFLEPTRDRDMLLVMHPPTAITIFNPRPKFRNDTNGSDSMTSIWCVWDKSVKHRYTKMFFATNWNK